MSEKLKFYKGLEENLVNIIIELGAIYHCTDTGNTYIGVIDLEGEVLEDGTYPLKLDLYSTVSDIYISDDEIEGGFEFVNADTLGGFPADEYALKSHVYEKIDEININSYATKEEVNALTYEDIGAAPAGDYATKDDLNTIDFPVDSVNGKTGVVELVAEDVGAPTIEYAKKVGNPHNLLDNSDFRNPVNQREQTSYTGNCYTIDRWRTYDTTAEVTVSTGYLRIVNSIYQHVNLDISKVYTFAVMNVNGEIICVSGKLQDNVYGPNIDIMPGDGKPYVRIWSGEKTEHLIWAALYEGEYTAETLPDYHPKGYAAELLECQRYYYKFSGITVDGVIWGGTAPTGATFSLFSPIPMRIFPTATVTEIGTVRANGNSFTPTDVIISAQNRNKLHVTAYSDYTGSGNHAASLFGFSVDLSADL